MTTSHITPFPTLLNSHARRVYDHLASPAATGRRTFDLIVNATNMAQDDVRMAIQTLEDRRIVFKMENSYHLTSVRKEKGPVTAASLRLATDKRQLVEQMLAVVRECWDPTTDVVQRILDNGLVQDRFDNLITPQPEPEYLTTTTGIITENASAQGGTIATFHYETNEKFLIVTPQQDNIEPWFIPTGCQVEPEGAYADTWLDPRDASRCEWLKDRKYQMEWPS